MSEEDESSKTEEPTPKKLQEARDQGNVIQSRDVVNFAMLGASALVLTAFGAMMSHKITLIARAFIERAWDIRVDDTNFTVIIGELLLGIAVSLLVPMGILAIAAFAAFYLQFGLLFAPKSIEPKLDKIDPIKGFGRLFSMRNIVEFLKGVAKIIVVGAAAIFLLWPEMSSIDRFVFTDVADTLGEINRLALSVVFLVVAIVAVVAGADYLYQRFAFMKQMRMSKHDLKEEFKNQEGDPHVKAKLRQIRMEKAKQRMMAAVPQATVVVTNPTHYAVALKYEDMMPAPKVVAKGVDAVALRIRELAKESNVPVVENPPLARTLYALVELDKEIPPDTYKAVAEVISFVMRRNQRSGGPSKPLAAGIMAATSVGSTVPTDDATPPAFGQ
ncbi:flagellar biosynthesis protein FlhB [Elstera cyanobacteriorum]|uniref:flagellar biosynthesis protein FlhB n=1 Tax=Elstera cyanobacteriorum TaxID=2022747 RepID=UPI002355BDE3|nr:flagellar biosynthesis protein FlhB [Elstera cyanobacteriorum]MCK6442091.1 flagellar biosynthesis protein FlhB [Elstera cyanobacteriorum]